MGRRLLFPVVGAATRHPPRPRSLLTRPNVKPRFNHWPQIYLESERLKLYTSATSGYPIPIRRRIVSVFYTNRRRACFIIEAVIKKWWGRNLPPQRVARRRETGTIMRAHVSRSFHGAIKSLVMAIQYEHNAITEGTAGGRERLGGGGCTRGMTINSMHSAS